MGPEEYLYCLSLSISIYLYLSISLILHLAIYHLSFIYLIKNYWK